MLACRPLVLLTESLQRAAQRRLWPSGFGSLGGFASGSSVRRSVARISTRPMDFTLRRPLQEPWLDASGPVSPLLVAIFGWVAEQERARLIERTKAGSGHHQPGDSCPLVRAPALAALSDAARVRKPELGDDVLECRETAEAIELRLHRDEDNPVEAVLVRQA